MNPTLALEKLRAALEAWPAFSLTEMRNFHAAANPLTIQALLDELEARKVESERLRQALSDCVDDLEYLASASDSAYARPDPETITAARAALTKE